MSEAVEAEVAVEAAVEAVAVEAAVKAEVAVEAVGVEAVAVEAVAVEAEVADEAVVEEVTPIDSTAVYTYWKSDNSPENDNILVIKAETTVENEVVVKELKINLTGTKKNRFIDSLIADMVAKKA